jgi:hypothetical protein
LISDPVDDKKDPRSVGGQNASPAADPPQSPYTPYTRPAFSALERCHFATTMAAGDMQRLDQAKFKEISFGPDFDVQDTHLAAICCRTALTPSLVSISLGDSDTATGRMITDHGVIILVRACPNLRVLVLNSATSLTDTAFLACCEACPSLEFFTVTGHDKINGKISSASLKRLESTPSLVPNLKELVLLDQCHFDNDTLRKLSKARPKLAIKDGNTLGDGVAANVIAAMTGGVSVRTWFGGKVINTERDFGCYGPGGEDFPYHGPGSLGMWFGFDDEDEEEDEEDEDEEEEEEEEDETEDDDDGGDGLEVYDLKTHSWRAAS